MTNEHPNVSILRRLNPRNLTQSADLFSEEFTWHFFNPKLPDVHGDYTGLLGLQGFFKKLSRITSGTFQVKPIAITAIGDELVVTHVKDRMTLENRAIELDAVVVWRIINGKIAEAWDIPAIYTEQLQTS